MTKKGKFSPKKFSGIFFVYRGTCVGGSWEMKEKIDRGTCVGGMLGNEREDR